MNILFVGSGKKDGKVSPIIFNQGESLRLLGVNVDYYSIKKGGLWGYLKELLPLRAKIKKGNYNVIHAHFSYSGFLVTLATPLKIRIIVSLMGTITKGSYKYFVIHFLAKYRWKQIIVKSELMKTQIGLKNAPIIPNGVDLEKFVIKANRDSIREKLGFESDQKIVIFVSDPARLAKNFKLCQESVKLLDDDHIKLLPVFNKPHEEVVRYMMAADVLMLGSLLEGSPNVIKEAMAANCPIVSTRVGDVSYLLDSLEGTYIMNTFAKEEGAKLLQKALDFNRRTKGAEQLVRLGLSDRIVAQKIINQYK